MDRFEDFVRIQDANTDPDLGRFVRRYNQIYWQCRNRKSNGLAEARAVFKAPDGQWWIHKPAYLAWFTQELEVQPHE